MAAEGEQGGREGRGEAGETWNRESLQGPKGHKGSEAVISLSARPHPLFSGKWQVVERSEIVPEQFKMGLYQELTSIGHLLCSVPESPPLL